LSLAQRLNAVDEGCSRRHPLEPLRRRPQLADRSAL